ncbi:NAD-dependent epimerase/dehydratase family protein [Cupriavidus plantarum]|uniref:UDP-glucose 4-epimerase n=1 Tax=Cupriavidus plantarum TaxID=942865 RepID=A0A316EWP1_9BURK|nr:SDR family oxidoreductase [Cupriavidus plantarum]PWK35569.1 UDP-glucose 4-epimerase [Cupriavidus plantarum]
MTSVLLTGASGYAGAAIRVALERAGMSVITAGRRPGDDLPLDLLSPMHMPTLPSGIDACVHAAAAHEILCRNDTVAAFTANVTATRALVRACDTAGIGQIVYLSTFHVFGAPRGDLTEDAVPVPGNDYGLTHYLAEQTLSLLKGRATVLRPANLFGTPAVWDTFDRWTLAPFDFARTAIREGRIRLQSDGSPIRNYVSLERLKAAVLAALSGELPPVTHVAGRPWSMHELAMLSADVARELTGRATTVSLGTVVPNEAPYTFRSLHGASEADDDGATMRAFVRAVMTRLMETAQ